MAKILTEKDRVKLIRLAKEQGIVSEDAKPLSEKEHIKLVKGKKIILAAPWWKIQKFRFRLWITKRGRHWADDIITEPIVRDYKKK